MIPIANPVIGDKEKRRVLQILDSGMLADGPEVRSFEEEFAKYCGTDHAVATSNGTTALHASLHAAGISHGDQVLTTPFSFIATANAIRHTGADPVFADINPETFNLDVDVVESILQNRGEELDAILAVHLYGLPCEMDRLVEMATEYDLTLIEDAAQAHGATYDGQRVGSIGDVACFSFYPTKNMTTGEGGMITTDDSDIAQRAAQFVNHGRTEKYGHAAIGHNFRMTSIAAAIGRVQLDRLPEYIQSRRQNAAVLTDGLDNSTIIPPIEPDNRTHVYHQYTVQTPDRDKLKSYLSEYDIGSGVYYPTCMHEQPVYDDVSHEATVGERTAEEVLSLPVHPKVSNEEIAYIVDILQQYE